MQLSCVEGSCRADLALQQVAPYPCPCAAPDGFLGYGRLVDELSLTREEQVRRLHVVPKRAARTSCGASSYSSSGHLVLVGQKSRPDDLKSLEFEHVLEHIFGAFWGET